MASARSAIDRPWRCARAEAVTRTRLGRQIEVERSEGRGSCSIPTNAPGRRAFIASAAADRARRQRSIGMSGTALIVVAMVGPDV
jgi:hypothetical protein